MPPSRDVKATDRPSSSSWLASAEVPSGLGLRISYGDPWETEPCDLLPPEAFHGPGESPTDRRSLRERLGVDEAATGPNSEAVRSRFASCTAGWPRPPTAAELYDAIRAERPSDRQHVVVDAWLREASCGDIVRAWLEEAYSWRELAAAIHRTGHRRHCLNRCLNQFAASVPD